MLIINIKMLKWNERKIHGDVNIIKIRINKIILIQIRIFFEWLIEEFFVKTKNKNVKITNENLKDKGT